MIRLVTRKPDDTVTGTNLTPEEIRPAHQIHFERAGGKVVLVQVDEPDEGYGTLTVTPVE